VALLLFLFLSGATAWLWNRLFRPVSWRLVALMLAIIAAYEGPALFTARVDFPGALAYNADPWRATGREPAAANTGIVFTELGPWTESARRAILAGEWPSWRAWWNGKRQPVVTVNDAFLGVFVPPGHGTLELRYRPDAFLDGLRISGAGTLIALGLLVLRLRRGR